MNPSFTFLTHPAFLASELQLAYGGTSGFHDLCWLFHDSLMQQHFAPSGVTHLKTVASAMIHLP